MTREQFFKKYNVLAKKRKCNVTKSTVTLDDVRKLEKKYNIKMPQEYIDFISVAAHDISSLKGVIDNFLAEDDVHVELEIPTQPLNNELSEIDELFSRCESYLNAGYIPIGDLDETGFLCIDTCMDGIFMKRFDYEWCMDFTTREEFESDGIMVFDCFEDFISCFFEGKKYDATKCEDYND